MATGTNIESLVIPGSVQPVALRPFGEKGIILNIPSQLVPSGGVLDAANYIATTAGLKRRPGIGPFTEVNVASYPPLQDAVGFWKVTGSQELLAIDQSLLYRVTPSSGFTAIYDEYNIGGEVTVAAAAVTGDRTKFQSAGLDTGDFLILDADGSGDGPEVALIASVNSETSITLSASPTGTYGAGTDFLASRKFGAAQPNFVDWTVITGGTPKIVFADGFWPLRSYNGTTLTDHFTPVTAGTIAMAVSPNKIILGTNTSFLSSGLQVGDLITLDADGSGHTTTGPEVLVIESVDSETQLTMTTVASGAYAAGTDYIGTKAGNFIPSCVCYHKDRLWCADINEGGSFQYRQRIKWSAVGDFDDFYNGGYLDLPYTQGAVKRLVPLGDFLLAYFDDAIFIGRPTNLPSLPLSFQRLETGGRGLLGMKAVTVNIDTHYFVGQDDVYALSAKGLEPIGSPVVKATIAEVASTRHWFIQAVLDATNDRILFGFPKSANQIEEIWSYNYKSGGWSYDVINADCLSANSFTDTKTWEDWVSPAYATGTVTTVDTDKTLEGSGADWVTAGVAAGDTVLIDLDSDGMYEFEALVDSVTDLNTLEMDTAATASGGGLSYRIVPSTATWEGSETDAYPTWESIRGSSTTVKDVYVGLSDALYVYEPTSAYDGTVAVVGVFETPDLDLNEPDVEKFFGYLSMKLESWNQETASMLFRVEGSTDRGQHWKLLGTLAIPVDKDEGAVNFRLRGSIGRFKVTALSASRPFTVNEVLIRARVLGSETPGRSDE